MDKKLYKYSDSEQLATFFHCLFSRMYKRVEVEKYQHALRINVGLEPKDIYNVTNFFVEIAERNNGRLGFAVNMQISQGVDTAPTIQISLRPPTDSWVWEMFDGPPDVDSKHVINASNIFAYYENEVCVDPQRAAVLTRISEQ